MNEAKYLNYKGKVFQYRLVSKKEKSLIWEVKLPGQNSSDAFGLLTLSGSKFVFSPHQTFPKDLTLDAVKCLTKFMKKVKKEQNEL